jgi:hypothetical protein
MSNEDLDPDNLPWYFFHIIMSIDLICPGPVSR